MNKAMFQKSLANLVQTASQHFQLEHVVNIGRIYQVSWFRKYPNDAILEEIERYYFMAILSKKSRPLAQAIRRAMYQR